MALESKPLFHPEILRQQVRSFNLPVETAAWQPKLQHWAELVSSGRADGFKESELLPDFLTGIFCALLGYTGPAEAAESYSLSRERHVEVDGEFADAVLGRFLKHKEQFVAVVESKGTRVLLYHLFTGRRMSATTASEQSSSTVPRLEWRYFLLTPPWNELLEPLWHVP